ncbi:monocarboxylate transporter 5-like [Ruditapes philippinarum]|uniref:monocarboxylate transporter 5-like n=1 Tax=Ruditapes philippinarum TaxID=129788 RepID=UPI00295BFC81|nr:monocarboxylate transporter 5-like [Ruditapes philippinarum]
MKMTQAKFFEYDEKEEYYDEEEIRPPRRPGDAPDGGWGWVVVIGAFICSMFVEGLLFSYHEVVSELSQYYHMPEASFESVFVLMTAFCLIGGPLTGALVHKFSCRKVVMVGSVITCALMLVSTQMPGVATIRLTQGVLAGKHIFYFFSLPEKKLTVVLMLRYQFEIWTNLFTVSHRRLSKYGMYQPSILIIAFWFEHKRAFATGLTLTGAGVGVFIFTPLYRHLLDIHDWKNATVILAALFLNCAAAGALFRPLTHAKPKGMKRGPIQRGAIMKALIAEKERQRTISNGSLDNCIITKDNRLIKIDKIDLRNKSNSYNNSQCYTILYTSHKLFIKLFNNGKIFKSGTIPLYRSDRIHSIIYNKMCCFFPACVIPLVHLPKKAVSLGISQEKSSFLISILWVANMIGRFAFGWVADRPWASAIQLNNTMIVLAGFLSLFGQFFNNNSWLGFYAAFFGLFSATFLALRSIVLIELYGKDRLISSMGLLTFFQGFAILLGYELSDILQGNVAFYLVGVLLVVGGLLGFPLPKVKRWEERRENKLKIVHIEELTQPEQETLKIENCESTI